MYYCCHLDLGMFGRKKDWVVGKVSRVKGRNGIRSLERVLRKKAIVHQLYVLIFEGPFCQLMPYFLHTTADLEVGLAHVLMLLHIQPEIKCILC
jgi:hypothetical protein